MTWECFYLVWISLWLVAIDWFWVPSVAMLAAGVGVVVAPWHRNYAQHIPVSWEDCFTVVGGSGDCWDGCFKTSVSHHQRWSLPHPHSETTDSKTEIPFLLDIDGNNSKYWELLNSSHALKIPYFTLKINRTIPIFCQGLNRTSVGIAGIFYYDLATTWCGIPFSTWFIPSQYRLCFALRHILGITGWSLCNDFIHYFHKLGGITYPDMQCSHPQCWDNVSGPNTLRAWCTSCNTRANLEANSWINNCIVASYFCSAHIIDICFGIMHWVNSCIVKSSPFSYISSWGLTLLTVSASATSLPGIYLISKSYDCIVSNTLGSLIGASGKKFLSDLF